MTTIVAPVAPVRGDPYLDAAIAKVVRNRDPWNWPIAGIAAAHVEVAVYELREARAVEDARGAMSRGELRAALRAANRAAAGLDPGDPGPRLSGSTRRRARRRRK